MDKVWETKALVKMNKSNEAKKLLDRLANICGPVMAKRNWRVKCLKEFYPKNAGLLGLNANRGASIFIRLRPPHDKDSFYPWDHILGTMVHELTHNTVGSHSAEFYKLMDQVHDEVEKSAGSAGTEKASLFNAVFMTESHRLGGSVGVKVNSSKAAADAAVKRARYSTLSSSSGQKLGGSSIPYADLSAADRRLLAANAAERRLKDDLWCHDDVDFKQFDDDDDAYGSLSSSKANGFYDKKSHSKENHNINNNYEVWICDGCSASNNSNSRQCERCFGSRQIKKGNDIAAVGITYERKVTSEAKYGNQKFAGCSCKSGSHDDIDFRSLKKEVKREQEILICGHCYEGNVEDQRDMKKKVKIDMNAPLKTEIGKSSIRINIKGTGSSSELINRDSSNNHNYSNNNVNNNNDNYGNRNNNNYNNSSFGNNNNNINNYGNSNNDSNSYGNNNNNNTPSSSSSVLINRKVTGSSSEFICRNSSNRNTIKTSSSSIVIDLANSDSNDKDNGNNSYKRDNNDDNNNNYRNNNSYKRDKRDKRDDNDNNNNYYNNNNVKAINLKENLIVNNHDYPSDDDEEVIVLGRQSSNPKSTIVTTSNQLR
jgi:ribosomal protein L40E